MKSLLILSFFLLSLGAGLIAQAPTIEALKSTAAIQKGEALLGTLQALAAVELAAGDWEASAAWADHLLEQAQSLRATEYIARAYHQKGLALAASDKRTQRNRALKSFADSNNATQDQELKKANWAAIRRVATALDKPLVVASADTELAILNGTQEAPAERSGLFGSRKRALNAAQTDRALAWQTLSLTQEQMQKQEAQLSRALASKEATLRAMNAEQMRREVMFLEQNRLLDSLAFLSVLDSLQLANQAVALSRKEMRLQQQTAEIDLHNSQRKVWMILAGLILAIASGLLHRHRAIVQHNKTLAEKNEIITAEKQRSEALLLNILPLAIANELKITGSAQARFYDQATVLFTDFKGFSIIAQQLPADELVEALDYAFKAFDEIIGRHKLEKIKTIGDAYMCAGGLPSVNETHPREVVQAGLDIQAFLTTWNTTRHAAGLPIFEARIGIHTGPLVAGVVGMKKFAYDIWGDTVNIASRMESSGQAGAVNISGQTYALVQSYFHCESRGFIEVKNLGAVEMYFVTA